MYFPDRLQGKPIASTSLPDGAAQAFLNVALKTNLEPNDRNLYLQWDSARRHLNNLEIFAFAYVYDFAERRFLAVASCSAMARSNSYFAALIHAFRNRIRVSQSWQLIPKAVEMMQHDFGTGCENAYPAGAKSISESSPGRSSR